MNRCCRNCRLISALSLDCLEISDITTTSLVALCAETTVQKDEVYSALVPVVDTWHEMSVTLDSRFNPSGANVPSLAEYSELHAMALAAKRLFERLVDKIQHATDVYWAKLTPSTTRLWRNSRLDQLIDICQRILDIFRGKRSHYLLTKSYRNAAWVYINRDTVRVSISDNKLYLHNHKRCHPFFSAN